MPKKLSCRRRVLQFVFAYLLLLLAGPLVVLIFGEVRNDRHWSQASRAPTGIAPLPTNTPEALIQVYAARSFSWRGAFGIHTWFAAKRAGADHYKVYHVLGWRRPTVMAAEDLPDRLWFDQKPWILAEIRDNESLIDRLEAAVAAYPYPDTYRIWPGPNSNTFTAFIARQLPELRLDLPATAIGKDYLPGGSIIATTPSGSGGQLSVFGLIGIAVGVEEGIEINVLGLNAGIDIRTPALRWPGVGRLGF
jgi:hypothetical protein